MIIYALEFALIHTLFFLVYKLLLTHETQLNFRRYFLLGATLLGLIIPLIDIPTSSPFATINLQEVFVSFDAPTPTAAEITIPWHIWLVVGVGVILLLKLIFGLVKIGRWYQQSEAAELYNTPIREVQNLQNSFTFLRWIFIDSHHFDNSEAVVRHEWGHSQHLHSLDVLFFHLLAIPFWWMPSIWLALHEVKKVHEYQADQYALKSTETESYIKTLVHSTMINHGMNLASSFDDTPIVKRLKFMKMIKRKINPWKVGSIVAIAAITCLTFACENELDAEIERIAQESSQQLAYSSDVQAALDNLVKEFPNEEFVVVETKIENMESLGKLKNYDSKLIKAMIVNWPEGEDYQTVSMILTKNGALFEKTIDVTSAATGEDEVFNIVEEQPQFPGGITEFYKFVAANIKYPLESREAGIEGRVFTQFIVDTDGSITNVRAVKGISPECDSEAIRVIQSLPKFIPGRQGGRLVKVRMTLPIVFSLDGKHTQSSYSPVKIIIEDIIKQSPKN